MREVNTKQLAMLAASLERSAAGLAAHIEARAAEIVAPQIKEIQVAAAKQIAAIERQAAVDKQRYDDVIAEFRKQLVVLERQWCESLFLTRYLPRPMRRLVMPGFEQPNDDRFLPREKFVKAAEETALQCGLRPFVKEI